MIYTFLAPGFEEIEALTTVDILRRAEFGVKTVGIGGKSITGSHGISVLTDMEDSDVVTEGIEAVVLPGGMPGTLNLEKSPIVRAVVEYAFESGILIAAICAAPSILGHLHMLNGREAICFPGYEQELFGARISEKHVCEDGPFITAKGAGVTVDFALKIVEKLANPSLSLKIRKSIQCM